MKLVLPVILVIMIFSFKVWGHPGVGIVMDSQGNVYYTDLIHVWKIDPEGRRSIAVHNVHTHELYLDAEDNLYGEHEWYNGEATDTWGNYVWRLSTEGNFEKIIPDVVGFLENTTLIRDPEGNSYWTRQIDGKEYLQRQDRNGRNSQLSDYPFEDIRWMHYSPHDDHLYVVDMLKILKVSPTGEIKVLAENLKDNKPPFQGLPDRHYVFGLSTDMHSNLYVAVYGACKVIRIEPNRSVSTVFETPEGWSASGILVNEDGTRWILEFSSKNETRVRQIRPDGTQELYGY